MLPRAFLLLALFVLSTFAAAAPAPLVVNIAGDLWSWTSAQGWTQLTSWGHNGPPVLSPDGRNVVYASVAQHAAALPHSPNRSPSWRPTNIYRLDLATRKATRLTAQPKGASGLRGLVRSTPTWSPDGRFLAWTEFAVGEARAWQTLVIHTVASGTTRIVRTKVPDVWDFSPAPLLWSPSGLVAFSSVPGNFPRAFVLDANGRILRRFLTHGNTRFLSRFRGSTYLTDFFSDSLRSLDGRPDALKSPGVERSPDLPDRLVATGAPNGLSVRFKVREMELVCQLTRDVWIMHEWACPQSVEPPEFPDEIVQTALDVALSADGRHVAYQRGRAIFVHDGSRERRILDLGMRGMYGMTWGPSQFRLP